MPSLLIAWYAITAISMAVLIWDLLTRTPTGAVMKLAWILVVAYTGPIGLTLYWLSCRQPKGQSHDEFIADHWKQATGSLLHCVAGDATGIIIAAALVYHFALPNGIDLIVEYLAAFIVGLLVFQALFMIKMYNGNYWLAVRKTFFAETVSMNMVMLGMFPAMMLLKHAIPNSDSPYRAEFWLVMSMATIAGMITAYPINSWMVRRGLKHGMMSADPKKQSSTMDMAEHSAHGSDQPMAHEHGDMKMEHGDMAPQHSDHGDHSNHSAHSSHAEHNEHDVQAPHDETGRHAHHSASLPFGQMIAWVVGTFLLLVAAVALTALAVPLHFTS